MQEKPLSQQIGEMKAWMRTFLEQDPEKGCSPFTVSKANRKSAYMVAAALSTEIRKPIIVDEEHVHG